MAITDIEIFGRKTFFIAPDTAIINSELLEELCAAGYEAYIINDDHSCRIQDKAEAIIRLFPNSILYFNIGAKVSGIEWESYLKKLQAIHREDALIGLLCASGSYIPSGIANSNKVYAGSIELKPHDEKTLDTIKAMLKKAGAKGRRNYVRANCDSKSTLNATFEGKRLSAKIEDVNISHFRCTFPSDSGMSIFEKIRNARIAINDLSFTSDAVLIMKRIKNNVLSSVFMFIHDSPDDLPDLDEKTRPLLSRNIYRTVTDQIMGLLKAEFKKI